MCKKNKFFEIKILILLLCIFFIFTGCGPSKEKIAQAQELYAQLADTHNQVVEAHKSISDSSLDEDLIALSEKIKQIEQYNLNELKDEQIDLLIESMNSIMASYQEYLDIINEIKDQEDAAILISIPASLQNNTDFTFQKLELYSKEDLSTQSNILEDTSGFAPGQFLTGLLIRKDVSSTPWVLRLEDTNGTSYELELSVDEYDETGISLTLIYDSESKELKYS